MPKRGLKRMPERVLTKQETLVCSLCDEAKKPSDFYQSFDALNKSGYVPMCKKCITNHVMPSGSLDHTKLKEMLQRMDKPYLPDILQLSIESGRQIVGEYFRMLALPQHRDMRWVHTQMGPEQVKIAATVTDDIKEFFGAGYSDEEYLAMQRKYNFLKNNYPGKTNMHVEALLNYVRPQVKCEMATACGNVGEAKTWATIAKDAAIAAKINPSQLSTADLQGGLNNFSRLVQAVEQEKDIIKIMPRFKYMPQDAPDFIIWCFVNYVRELQGLPTATYADVYSFYDKKKQEYMEQYGDPFEIFKDDVDLKNREAIEKFVLDYGAKMKQDKNKDRGD